MRPRIVTSKTTPGNTGFATDLQETARRKLRMPNNSVDVKDLMNPPSNRLEKLKATSNNFILSELTINGVSSSAGTMAALLTFNQ